MSRYTHTRKKKKHKRLHGTSPFMYHRSLDENYGRTSAERTGKEIQCLPEAWKTLASSLHLTHIQDLSSLKDWALCLCTSAPLLINRCKKGCSCPWTHW